MGWRMRRITGEPSAVSRSEVQFWTRAAQDLRIEIITPFEVIFHDGSRLHVAALIKNFGPPNGMLVNDDYAVLAPYTTKILESGYGYASNLGSDPTAYTRPSLIEILKDWGWSGAESKKPDWLDC